MRTITFLLITFVFVVSVGAQQAGNIGSPDGSIEDTDEPAAHGDTLLALKLHDWLTVSLHVGVLITPDNLVIDEDSDPTNGVGIPLGVGLGYSVGNDVTCAIEFAYTPFPEWFHLWGSHESWSMLEFGASLRRFNQFTLNKSIYWKLGVKIAQLRGSRSPGEGLFGGTVGEHREIKTGYEPGGELAVGLMKINTKEESWFVELTFNRIWLEGSEVRVNGETDAWRYPHNLTLYGIKAGILISM